MLARHLRLKRPQDFQRIRDQGQHHRGRLLSLNVLGNDLPNNRFGFVVSRRVGTAVVRNRVKRRLRTAVRNRLDKLVGGFDVVIIGHAAAAAASYRELDARLVELFQKAGLLD